MNGEVGEWVGVELRSGGVRVPGGRVGVGVLVVKCEVEFVVGGREYPLLNYLNAHTESYLYHRSKFGTYRRP